MRSTEWPWSRSTAVVAAAALALAAADPALAFRVIDLTSFNQGNTAYARWDAAARSVEGVERSLDGGLRYSLEGGSFQAFRDEFTWSGTAPSVASFQAAVEQAFAAWVSTDPATQLPASFEFVADLGTSVVLDPPADPEDPLTFTGLNDGAEIDLHARDTDEAGLPDACPGRAGCVWVFIDTSSINDLELSSGVTGYPGGAIAGADLVMDVDPPGGWTLDSFQLVLTHELGHTLGLTDVDLFPGPSGLNSAYLDDDYDGSTSATALATLTNAFADLIDSIDPDASSALAAFSVPNADPGLDTAGVDILMETDVPGSLEGIDVPLQPDDYAGRQFLYPVLTGTQVPTLGPGAFGVLLAALLAARARRRARPA